MDNTIIYLPPAGGAWFGPPFEIEQKTRKEQQLELDQLVLYGVGAGPGAVRPCGEPSSKPVSAPRVAVYYSRIVAVQNCRAQAIARARQSAKCIIRDVTLVRAAEDAHLTAPMISVLSQTLELDRVKVCTLT